MSDDAIEEALKEYHSDMQWYITTRIAAWTNAKKLAEKDISIVSSPSMDYSIIKTAEKLLWYKPTWLKNLQKTLITDNIPFSKAKTKYIEYIKKTKEISEPNKQKLLNELKTQEDLLNIPTPKNYIETPTKNPLSEITPTKNPLSEITPTPKSENVVKFNLPKKETPKKITVTEKQWKTETKTEFEKQEWWTKMKKVIKQ